jgi:hypothetical protein
MGDTPTNTPPPEREPTPTDDPTEVLIPVTGVELSVVENLSRRFYLSLAAIFFGVGLLIQTLGRRRGAQ